MGCITTTNNGPSFWNTRNVPKQRRFEFQGRPPSIYMQIPTFMARITDKIRAFNFHGIISVNISMKLQNQVYRRMGLHSLNDAVAGIWSCCREMPHDTLHSRIKIKASQPVLILHGHGHGVGQQEPKKNIFTITDVRSTKGWPFWIKFERWVWPHIASTTGVWKQAPTNARWVSWNGCSYPTGSHKYQ